VQLFEKLDAGQTEYTVRASFLEIYNEDIFDLLSSEVSRSARLLFFAVVSNCCGCGQQLLLSKLLSAFTG
jgi:hypothetical protein